MKRSFWVLMLCLCLLTGTQVYAAGEVSGTAISLDLAAGSVEIYESEGITYCVQNEVTQATTGGVILRQTDSGIIATTNTVTVSGGTCKVTISSLSIIAKYYYQSPILVENGASLDLTLLGSSTVTGGEDRAGIHVPDGSSLTVGGSGSIAATGGENGAGIGGGIDGDSGSITINDGTVTANGGRYGAGIGGGMDGNGGSITINGGTVASTGGDRGAGIGGGGDTSSGGIIAITNGTVTATGGLYGAGIGNGYDGNGGTITITGGIVTATGGRWSADVGAGYLGSFDAVTISEKVTVTNDNGEPSSVVESIFVDTQPLPTATHLNHTPVSSVTAHGHSGLSYQWQIYTNNEDWSNLEGETSSTISSISMTEELDSAYLRCKLINGWGNVQYTDAVQIYVLAFAQQPTSVEANLNDMVVFEAISTCSNVSYQWQRSYDEGATWSNVPGETFSTLMVNATLTESSVKYRCVITATNGDWLASDEVCVNVNVTETYEYTIMTYLQNLETMEYEFCEQIEATWESGGTINTADYEGFSENGKKRTQEGVLEDGALVIHCYFDRNTYSITFDTNGGGALSKLEALYGADIDAPSAPSRYGHTFAGWYADEDLTEAYTFDTMPLGGATVYAKWMPVGADRGVEYTINDLAIRDSCTFELLDDIPDGQFLVEVSVTNLKSTQVDTVLLAYYTNRGQMIGMQYLFANTPVGYTTTFGASVDNSNGDIGRITAFVLPSLGNPIPLAQSVTIQ